MKMIVKAAKREDICCNKGCPKLIVIICRELGDWSE